MDSNQKIAESKACTQSAEPVAAADIELKVPDDAPAQGGEADLQNEAAAASAEPVNAPPVSSAQLEGQAESAVAGEADGGAVGSADSEPAAPNLSLHASAIPLSIKPEMSIDWPLSRRRQIFNVFYFGLISLQLYGLVEQGVAPWLIYICLTLSGLFTTASIFYLFNHRHHQTSSDELSPRARRSIRAAGLLIPAFMLMGLSRIDPGNRESVGNLTPPVPAFVGSDFDAEMKAGRALFKKHKYAEALSHFERASAIDPGSDSAFEWIANSDDSMFNFSAAISAATHSLELNPDNENAHVILGHSYNMRGRYVDAEAVLRQAIALDPEDGEAYGYLSTALNGLGRPEEALLSDNNHVKYHSNEWRAFEQRARTLDRLGRTNEARYVRELAEKIRNSVHTPS